MTRAQAVVAWGLVCAWASGCGDPETAAPVAVPTLGAALDRALVELALAEAPEPGLVVWGRTTPLTEGHFLSASRLLPTFAPVAPAWLLWVDDHPGARLAHASRAVLVAMDSGLVTWIPTSTPPMVDGQPVFAKDGDPLGDTAAILYRSPSAPGGAPASVPAALTDPPPLNPPAGWRDLACPDHRPPTYHAILVEGGGFGHEAGEGDVALVAQALGTFKGPDGSPLVQVDTIIQGNATVPQSADALLALLERFRSGPDKLDCCDHLFLYLSTHGEKFIHRKGIGGQDVELSVHDDGKVSAIGDIGTCWRVSCDPTSVAAAVSEHALKGAALLTGADGQCYLVPAVSAPFATPAVCAALTADVSPDEAAQATYGITLNAGGPAGTGDWLGTDAYDGRDFLAALTGLTCNTSVYLTACFGGGMVEHMLDRAAVYQAYALTDNARSADFNRQAKAPGPGDPTTFMTKDGSLLAAALTQAFASVDANAPAPFERAIAQARAEVVATSPFVIGGVVDDTDGQGGFVQVVKPAGANVPTGGFTAKECICCGDGRFVAPPEECGEPQHETCPPDPSGVPQSCLACRCTSDTCVPAGTPVLLADGRERAIESLRPGDRIAALDQAVSAAEVASVAQLLVHTDGPYLLDRVIAEGGHELVVTANHPVRTRDRGFVTVEELRPGDVLLAANPATGVIEEASVLAIIRQASKAAVVYNLQTTTGTYFAADLLVHNKCVAAGSRVDTPSGPVPIEAVRPGAVVWAANAAGQRVATHVTAVFTKATVLGRLPGKRLAATLAVTDNHLVASEEGFAPAGTLPLSDDADVGLVGTVYDLATEAGTYYASGVLLRAAVAE